MKAPNKKNADAKVETEQLLHKVPTAMRMLDVCRATIYRMSARGELDIVKIGTATRITGASIDRLISGKSKQ